MAQWLTSWLSEFRRLFLLYLSVAHQIKSPPRTAERLRTASQYSTARLKSSFPVRSETL